MRERKDLNPIGIDLLRAAVVGQAAKDYLDLCRVNNGRIPIPYKISKREMAVIRYMYFTMQMTEEEIAKKMRFNKQAVRSVLARQERYAKKNTSFIETKRTLKNWFESDEFNMMWCDEPGENITRYIEQLAEQDRKNKSVTKSIGMKRKINSAYNEEIGV